MNCTSISMKRICFKNENFNGTSRNKERMSIIPIITCIITDAIKDV